MQRELCAYLRDMLDASQAIFSFTSQMSAESFEGDDLVRSAVERKFEIIGEALRQGKDLYPGKLDAIRSLRQIVGQRNHIAHGYFATDPLILWASIQSHLGDFQREVQALFDELCRAQESSPLKSL